MPLLTLVELFAGTGAFSLAFKSTQTAQPIFATDISVSAKKLFDANHSIPLTLRNIHDLKCEEIPSMDILTAGFPCQPFSIAGKQKGFEDERSNVFWKMMDIISFHLPRIVLLENVKRLLTHDGTRTFERIRNGLEQLGYITCYKVMNVCEFTRIPQNRERVFILCFLNESDAKAFEWPEPNRDPLLTDWKELDVNPIFYYSPSSSIWDSLRETVIDSNTVYQFRRVYVRENKKGMCPTLTHNMGGGGHNVPIILDKDGIRKLTPRECFTLQGFPDSFVIDEMGLSNSALYSLAGNAVCVQVAQKIAIQIGNLLG